MAAKASKSRAGFQTDAVQLKYGVFSGKAHTMTAKPVKSDEEGSVQPPEEAPTTDAATTITNVEGDIREFVRRDVVATRKVQDVTDLGANNISFQIERVAGMSIKEIDNLIGDLQAVREFLRSEGERVAREITSYTQASQAAVSSAKIISDSMGEWKASVGAMRAARR